MSQLKSYNLLNSGRAALAALFACLTLVYFTVFTVTLGWNANNAMAEINEKTMIEIQTSGGPQIIAVEIAQSAEAQARGLMYRRSLAPKNGMLFLYGTSQEITMWMRNTYISLDMVFIKNNGRVHSIARHTEPFSEALINSEGNVTGVLEIGSGEALKLGINIGDLVVHPHFKN